MKCVALILLLALSALTTSKADDARVSFDFFYETLAPYGEWFSVEGYGYVWRPTEVAADWAPYTDGYWAYTDAGWTWVSYEDWGSITYHYGRWIVLRDFGWCWVPDYVWGPAWVSWRTSNEYIGWAPLPPEARWQVDTGFGTWVDAHFQIGPGAYRFCRVPDFGSPVIRNVLLPPPWNVTFIERTANVTNITYRRDFGCVFNGGLDFAWVTPLLARPLPALRLVRNTENVIAPGRHGNVLLSARIGQTLHFGAPPPLAAGAPGTPPPPPPRVARTIAAPIIDRGWSGPANDPVRERLAAKFRQEIQGATPQTAPARPFHPDLVAMVPTAAVLAARPPGPPPVPPMPPATIGGRVLPPPPVVPPPAAIPSQPIQEPARRVIGNRQSPPFMPPPGVPAPSVLQNREPQRPTFDQPRAAETNAMRMRNEATQRFMEIQRQSRPVFAPPTVPRQQAPPPPAASSRPPPPPPGALGLPGQPPPPPQAGRPPPPPPGFPPPPFDPRRRGP
jgi:hypothetical protein